MDLCDDCWTFHHPSQPCYVRLPPVLTKADFVKRYQKGEFGNTSPTWNTPDDFWYEAVRSIYLPRLKFADYYLTADGKLSPMPLYHLRSRKVGGKTHYNLTAQSVLTVWDFEARQEKGSAWYCSSMCPHEHNLLQGEVLQTEQGLYLNYSTVVGKPMREALAIESKHAYGILAVCLLRGAMCPNSYEWLQVLLDRYSGHTVEFTSLGIKWGTLPHYNTLFWEVRNY